MDAFKTINPPVDINARIGFNVTSFIRLGGLGVPLGASFFTVQNGTVGSAVVGGSVSSTAGATASVKTSISTVSPSSSVKASSTGVVVTASGNATKTASSTPLQVTKNAAVVAERGSLAAFVVGAVWVVGQL